MTYVIPRPDWVSDRLIEDPECGPYAGFQMYTRAGNDALAQVVIDAVQRSEAFKWRRAEFLNWLKNAVAILSLTHGEVRDTEPEWAIVDALKPYFDAQGWVPIGRDDL